MQVQPFLIVFVGNQCGEFKAGENNCWPLNVYALNCVILSQCFNLQLPGTFLLALIGSTELKEENSKLLEGIQELSKSSVRNVGGCH